jgi:hypothetical protein
MKRVTVERVFEAVTSAILPGMQAMADRIAKLEKHAGISTAQKEHKTGDVIEMGNAKWICRGAGRWRRMDERN